MRLSAVIGTNYGDEGKGHVVDCLSDNKCLVIRFNGGAQAAHTVIKSDGSRHVFHHFGSGTFNGAATYFSKHFIVNPVLFSQELLSLPPDPIVLADPRCLVTTPVDMILNQTIEALRGKYKHGSCGLGINETVTRSEAGFAIVFRDLSNRSLLKKKIELIVNFWLPRRMRELNIIEDLEQVDNKQMWEQYYEDCAIMTARCESFLWPQSSTKLPNYEHFIFEGAQGLLLDEYGKDFPHVTRSRTGLTNVLAMLEEARIKEMLDIYYVTRPYLTRHGAGPLENELKEAPYGIVDITNQPNMHQDILRYAWLDITKVGTTISHDYKQTTYPLNVILAITCLDQMPQELQALLYGKMKMFTHEAFIHNLEDAVQADCVRVFKY